MTLDYTLLDKDYLPSAKAQERIVKDVECVGAAFVGSKIKPLLVVDGKECEKASRELVRVLGYETQTPTIIYTTGAPVLGMVTLKRSLEELTRESLDNIAEQTPLRLDMLLRLQKSAKQVADNQ